MHITKIKIENYRALQNIEIPLQELSILIGQNDAGKTSVLNAIEAFFKQKKLEAINWHKKQVDIPIVIELSFEDVPSEYALTSDKGVIIKGIFDIPEKAPSYSYVNTDGGEVSLDTKMKKYFSNDRFVFIPVKRDINDQFSASKSTSMLRKILDAVMLEELEKDAKVKKDIKNVASFLEKAIKKPEQKIQEFLREQLKDSIQFSFSHFDVNPIGGMSFTTSLSDSGSSDIDLSSKGAGTQNNVIIALFRYLAVSGVAKNFIFGIEEPENSLHPKAQRQLLTAIQEISESTQVIVTTHSPVFIDRSHYKNNILMTMSPEGKTVAKTFQDIKDDDVRMELGIRASDALLSGGGNCALLVEGNTEKGSFPVFMKMMGLDEINLGISIIPIDGSSFSQCRILIRLLSRYDIPCVVALDNDAKNCAKELERAMNANGSDMPKLEKVFCWKEGAIEEYYPPEIVLEAIEKEESITLTQDDRKSVQDSTKKGIKKYTEILHSYKLNEKWLKNLIGDKGARLMRDKGENVPEEIQDVLKYVEAIAQGKKPS